jgi:zinc protease
VNISQRKGLLNKDLLVGEGGIAIDVERTVLDNGVVLLLSESHTAPSVSINAVVITGSRHERDEKAGLASLVGELIDEGTSMRSSHQIAEEIEAVGGRLATFGDYQSSGAHTTLLAGDFDTGLDIVADVLMNAAFPQDQITTQIERRAAQIRSRLDVPRTQASDIFNEIVFRDTPRHRPAVGYEESVKKLVRDDFVEFYQSYFVPNNTIVSIVGDIDKDEVRRKVEDSFGSWARQADFHSSNAARAYRRICPRAQRAGQHLSGPSGNHPKRRRLLCASGNGHNFGIEPRIYVAHTANTPRRAGACLHDLQQHHCQRRS